jgi:polar amino acid transport system substrate-binding protein
VDAIVVDLPTAFFLTAAEVPEAKIVGQFPAPGGDDWGLLLEKDSALTPCVSRAVAALRSAGTLDRLQRRYMGGDAAPDLR